MQFLIIVHVVLGLALIASIAVQVKGKGLGRTFGAGGTYFARRGAEKLLFRLTVALSVIFFITSLISIIV